MREASPSLARIRALRCRLTLPAVAALLALSPGFAATGSTAQAPPEPGPPPTMAPLEPAEIDEALAIGGEEIDAAKLSSRMTVEVQVNGTGPHRFIVDSGADTSVVGQRLATRLAMPPGERALLNAMTESAIVDRVVIDELQLGPTAFYSLEVPVLREADIGAAGMVGLDALVNQRLMMDFEKRIISVDDARTPPPRWDGAIVVTGRLQRSQLILTQVRAQGVKVDAVVDTGTEISIGNSALREKLLRRRGDIFETVTIVGVTGAEAKLEIATIPELRLGSVTLLRVPIAFADVPPFAVFGLAEEPALLLGTDVMETFRKVSLDFRERKVRFQLKKCDAAAIRMRTAPGLVTRLMANRPTACDR